MAYQVADDPGSIRFLLGDAIMQLTRVVMDATDDLSRIDAEVRYLDGLASYYTDADAEFQKEWKAVQEGRKFKWGQDAVEDFNCRLEQLRCIVRSLCRKGIITKPEAPTSEYVPAFLKNGKATP